MAFFAIVPAAGLSRRMGQPKLVMDVAGRTVIDRLLATLSHPSVLETVIVIRRSDVELAEAINALALRNVHLVQPEVDPPDMRRSVQHGIDAIRNRHSPALHDAWLLIPADHPILDRQVLVELIDAWRTTDEEILIPQHDGRNGHPAFFRWSIADRLPEIPDDKGLNWLQMLDGIRIRKLPVDSDSILFDMDTPGDYKRILRHYDISGHATPEP